MGHVTWRASPELLDRVRRAAAAEQRSVNEYLTRLAEAATNPELAGDDIARIRERLARAGLLAPPGQPRSERPDPAAVAKARREAGQHTPLSDFATDPQG
jgi:hypothetical protein